jgi:hypothetical protein
MPEPMLQNIANILDWSVDPERAITQPHYYGPSYTPDDRHPGSLTLGRETIREGEFSRSVLDGLQRHGQAINAIPGTYWLTSAGSWIGIHIDSSASRLTGSVRSTLRAHVEGF